MLLDTPERTPYDLEFEIARIPVRVHPLFWLVTIVLGSSGGPFDPLGVLLWVIVVFFSILIHELGHAFVIRWFGGHPWVVLYAAGGLAGYESGLHRRRGNATFRSVAISFAGPAAGFLFAAILAAGLLASGYRLEWRGMHVAIDEALWDQSEYLALTVSYLFFVNIAWGLVNLLPILPLDGGRISEALLVHYSRDGFTQALYVSLATAIAAVVYALFQLHDTYLAVFFGLMGFYNYQLLQSSRFGRWR